MNEKKQKVTDLLKSGLSQVEIAEELGVTKQTFNKYLWSVYFKDGIDGGLIGEWTIAKKKRQSK